MLDLLERLHMKGFLFILLSITYSMSFSQGWCRPGAHWKKYFQNWIYYGFYTYVYETDTVVDGQLCNAISQHIISSDYFCNGCVGESDLADIFAFEQNDTVFFYHDGSFYPTYYFNTAVGDTINYQPNYSDTNIIRQVITEVGLQSVDGQQLKYYKADVLQKDSANIYPTEVYVIEGIGPPYGFFVPDFYEVPNGTVIDGITDVWICTYTDSTLNYNSNLGYCDLELGVNDMMQDIKIDVYPNPAGNTISVTYNGSSLPLKYNISNLYGQQLFYESVNYHKDIDVSNLANGIYFLTVEAEQGIKSVVKFVKK